MDYDSISYLKDFPSFTEEGAPLCAQTDPEIFFPVDHSDSAMKKFEYYSNEREAKAICAECPYKAQCLEYAIKDLEIQGIWGATTQIDRRKMMKRLRIRK